MLKLSEGEGLPAHRLAQLANGHWRVNVSKLRNVKHVIVMIHMGVRGDFTMSDAITFERATNRVSDLGLVDAENATGQAGCYLHGS